MNGPDHYREAERLLARAATPAVVDGPVEQQTAVLAAAQVHADLAAVARETDQWHNRNVAEWAKVTA